MTAFSQAHMITAKPAGCTAVVVRARQHGINDPERRGLPR